MRANLIKIQKKLSLIGCEKQLFKDQLWLHIMNKLVEDREKKAPYKLKSYWVHDY